ncbi:MAG: DEAD/DEAH box helicase [Planctomycetes bacterium]|jgi:ATP-dependent RNA helicase RhlE|nr:DEAD/DEAH box helicase [Planctomycetota bacterium]MCP4839935.1 DEAD/DEAH box helicase [Planctomycetota bacterium]
MARSKHPDHETPQKAARLNSEDSFGGLGIGPILVNRLSSQGMERPRAVQAQVIPAVLEGRDVLSLAETGSGKTAAFLAPVLQKILADRPAKGQTLSPAARLRGLVICPTRELADQTGALAEQLARGTVLRTAVAVGTVAITPQRRALASGVDLLVGTPGRLNELIADGALQTDAVQSIVLDEADRMFDMGFAPQIERILSQLPGNRQMLLFTATMPKDVLQLANHHLRGAVRIETHPHTTAATHVTQHAVLVEQDSRIDLLLHLIREGGARRMLIFCRTRRRTGWVASALSRHGLKTGQLHGDRSQAQRRRALDRFASGEIDVLVATDVGSRGLHIKGVPTVVNYDLPGSAEDLVHRAGRASHGTRKKGDAWTLLGPKDLDRWYELAPQAGVAADPERIPGFSPSEDTKRPRGSLPNRHETRHRPGPGRRKRASRPIPKDQKPGRGVRRPKAD